MKAYNTTWKIGWAAGAVFLLLAQGLGCGGKSGGGEDVDGGVDGDVQDAEVQIDAAPDCTIDATRVYDDVALLAGPGWEGRKPGTAGNLAAVDNAEALFQDLGLVPAGEGGTYRQSFVYDQWEPLGPPELTLDGTTLTVGTDYRVFFYSGSGSVTAEVVFAGHGMTVPPFDPAQYPNCTLDASGYDDYDGIDVTGKIALVLRHGPADNENVYNYCPANQACDASPCLWNFGYKAANARLHGAAAMILVQDYHHTGEMLDGATLDTAYFAADFPAVFAERARVEAAVPDLPLWADAINTTLQPASQTTAATATVTVDASIVETVSENLLGAVAGTDATLMSEAVVVGAHIDHLGVDPFTSEVYLGADDNASGTAVVMELARMLTCEIEPARTVLFALWNAEEVGLVGSCFYVDNPTLSLANTVAMFSVDMVGAGDGSGVALFGGLARPNAWLVEVMEGRAGEMGLPYSVTAADVLEASDHACFAYAGVPAVLVTTLGPHAYYHTPEDTIDNILADDLKAGAWMMWAVLEPLALGLEDDYVSNPANLPPLAPVRPRTVGYHPWLRNR